jgi:hypothetical protein
MSLALVVALGACGGDDDDDTSSDTTVESAPDATGGDGDDADTTEALSPEDEVLRDYRAATSAFAAAANPPNPDDADLAARYTGEAFTKAQETLRTLQGNGAGADNTVEHNPIEIDVTNDTASIEDCFVDTTQLVNLESGEAIGEPEVTSMHADVSLERVDGTWKIAQQTLEPAECAPT